MTSDDAVGMMRDHARRLKRLALTRHEAEGEHPELLVTAADRRYLASPYDASVALPPDADKVLTNGNSHLRDLRTRYAALDLPSRTASRWNSDALKSFLDPRYFRGDTLITWHYRELPRATRLKFFIYAEYVRRFDHLGLLDRLVEDGAFGCWTFSYPGHPRYSRDLLESVNEINFLERTLRLSSLKRFSVLDIGAGYGRLAHRMIEAHPLLDDYCCVDGIAESTFLCNYYLSHRGCVPPARIVALDEVESSLIPDSFDLAVNIHSFSECTYEAVAWWVKLLQRLRVPRLLIVPNERDRLLTLEVDGSRRSFMPLLEQSGYQLTHCEQVVQSPAVSDLLHLDDRFHLFSLRGS